MECSPRPPHPPIAAIFVPASWQWALDIAPTFWAARLYWALGGIPTPGLPFDTLRNRGVEGNGGAGEPGWWVYLLAGLAYQALLLAALLRRFERVML